MYKCKDCGALFDSPKLEMSRVADYWGFPASEPWGVCPECGSGEFDIANQCPMCGEYYTVNRRNCCNQCLTTISEAFQDTINELAKDWSCNTDEIKEALYGLVERDEI